MTKQIELPSGRYLLVQVGKDWFDFEIVHSTLESCDVLEYKNPVIWNKYRKGNCDWNTAIGSKLILVGKADQLTEDQWEEIVEMILKDVKIEWDVLEGWVYGNVYQDYEDTDTPKYTAKGSGLSLIKGHGFEIDTTLILKID